MKLNRKAGALCAVMFLLSWFFPFVPSAAAANEADYIYAVDIEYGSMAFYYDYGIWNVNTMRYEAAATSDNPAAGTKDGLPGWYGFDKKANRITVINRSAGKYIDVDLTYRSLYDYELSQAGAPAVVNNVDMTVTGEDGRAWLNNSVRVSGENGPNSVVGYIQLSGEPQVDGERYESSNMYPIGMFTLTISAWEE